MGIGDYMPEENDFFKSFDMNSQDSINGLLEQEEMINNTGVQHEIDELVNAQNKKDIPVEKDNSEIKEILQTVQIGKDSTIYRPVGYKRR